jgi:hypothetical protein
LKILHQAVFLLWHFRRQDAAAGSHPLRAAGAEQTGISLVIVMAHAPCEHVGNGHAAALRMRSGKTLFHRTCLMIMR